MTKYSDSDPLQIIQRGYNERTRSLMFQSSPLPVEKLQEALDIISGYNLFDSKRVGRELVGSFNDCKFIVGREYSVCIYLIPSKTIWVNNLIELQKRTLADEVSVMPNGTIRLWWD